MGKRKILVASAISGIVLGAAAISAADARSVQTDKRGEQAASTNQLEHVAGCGGKDGGKCGKIAP